MAIKIRHIKKEDLISLFDISSDCKEFHRVVAKAMIKGENEIEKCVLAIDDSKIVGYIYAFILPNKALLPEFLYVIPEYRKKHIAQDLLNYIEKESGCSSSMVFYNKELSEFYKKNGYFESDNLSVAIKKLES